MRAISSIGAGRHIRESGRLSGDWCWTMASEHDASWHRRLRGTSTSARRSVLPNKCRSEKYGPESEDKNETILIKCNFRNCSNFRNCLAQYAESLADLKLATRSMVGSEPRADHGVHMKVKELGHSAHDAGPLTLNATWNQQALLRVSILR